MAHVKKVSAARHYVERATLSLQSAIAHLNAAEAELKELATAMEVELGHTTSKLAMEARKSTSVSLAMHQVESKTVISPLQQAILQATMDLKRANALEINIVLVAALSGYLPDDSSFLLALDSLSSQGLVSVKGKVVELTDRGISITPTAESLLTSSELSEKIAHQLPRLPSLAFRWIVEQGSAGSMRDGVVTACGRSRIDGPVLNAISLLQRLGLIQRTTGGRYVGADMLSLE